MTNQDAKDRTLLGVALCVPSFAALFCYPSPVSTVISGHAQVRPAETSEKVLTFVSRGFQFVN